MVDDKDEYEFSDLPGHETAGEDEFEKAKYVPPASVDDLTVVDEESHMTRNIIIGLVVILLGIAGYKLAGVYVTPKPNPDLLLAKMDEQTSKQSNIEDFLKSTGKSADTTSTPEATVAATVETQQVPTMPVQAPEAKKVDVEAPAKMSETAPLPPKPATSETASSMQTMALSKDLEKKFSNLADQSSSNQESMKRFEVTLSSLQKSMDKMDQHLNALDDQMRASKMQQQAQSTLATRSRVQASLMQGLTTPPHHIPVSIQASSPMECYQLESMTRRSIIITRTDNGHRYEVYPGGNIPKLKKEDGRCINTGTTVMLEGFSVDSGRVHLSHGQILDSYRYYAVDAMVEGRAWLKTENGSIITVDKGAVLPNYGRVTEIDLLRGIVNTSSGKVIQYSADER